MKLSDLDDRTVARTLQAEGLGLTIGPFLIRLRSAVPYVAEMVLRLYAEYELLPGNRFFDFHVAVESPKNLRRLLGRQAQFYLDGDPPFKPLPLNQAFPFFEWGLNWVVAEHAHQYLILHAAVVEKDGIAAILPGNPGAGKSTLCAALVASGWRLLSDEMALIPAAENTVIPVPRPVSLKNQSIDVMKGFAPQAVFGDSFHDTAKGTIAHMRAPSDSVKRSGEPARPGLLIFPHFEAGAEPMFEPVSRADAFLQAVEYSFNYDFLAIEGVRRLQRLVDSCTCYSFTYPSLEAALGGFHRVWDERVAEVSVDV